MCPLSLPRTLALVLLLVALPHSATRAAETVSIPPDYHPPYGGGPSALPQNLVLFGGRLVMHGPFGQAGSLTVNQGPVAWTTAGFSTSGLPENVPDDPMTLHGGSLVFGVSVWNGSTLEALDGAEVFDILGVDASWSGDSGLAVVADVEPDPELHGRRHLLLWDGSEWKVQAAFDGSPRAMLEFDGAWFLGSNFEIGLLDGSRASLLRYDGSWSLHPETSTILDLCVADGQLFAASFAGLFLWNGTSFDLMPGTESGEFHDVIEWQGGLAVAGSFPFGLGGTGPCNVATWDGVEWTALPRLGAEPPDLYPEPVAELIEFEGELYAAGYFETGSQPEPARYVARLVGSRWVGLEAEIGFGIDQPVRAITVHEGVPIASLSRLTEGPQRDATFQLQHNGWWEFSSAFRDGAQSYLSTPSGLVAVGHHRDPGSSFTEAVVERWDGQSWELLARGTSETFLGLARAAAMYDGELIVGGDFDELEGQALSSLAAFDGSQWHALGGAFEGEVHDLIVFDGELVAIGNFWSVGNDPIQHVARWNGEQWGPMGDGFSAYGLCLAVADGTLYAGGALQWSGASFAPYLARWDGMAWQSVPDPPDRLVEHMAGIGGGLYLAGRFTQAGGVAVDGFAKFVHATQSWETPEFLPNGKVLALHREGSDLYLGGEFTELVGSEGAVSADHVARVRFETGVDAPPSRATFGARFESVFPSPANPRVTLRYSVSIAGRVEVLLYDGRGRRVRRLVDARMEAGEHTTHWDGRDDRGRSAASGVYFARLRTADGDQDTRKLVLAR